MQSGEGVRNQISRGCQKSFWKYSNDKLKTRDKVNDLLKEDGSLTKNDNE